jgi:hypothetical protein
MINTTKKLTLALESIPCFAMRLSHTRQGPLFYNRCDKDLKLVKSLFPTLIIGFYSSEEIALTAKRN